jgi:hypothetical protein
MLFKNIFLIYSAFVNFSLAFSSFFSAIFCFWIFKDTPIIPIATISNNTITTLFNNTSSYSAFTLPTTLGGYAMTSYNMSPDEKRLYVSYVTTDTTNVASNQNKMLVVYNREPSTDTYTRNKFFRFLDNDITYEINCISPVLDDNDYIYDYGDSAEDALKGKSLRTYERLKIGSTYQATITDGTNSVSCHIVVTSGIALA